MDTATSLEDLHDEDHLDLNLDNTAVDPIDPATPEPDNTDSEPELIEGDDTTPGIEQFLSQYGVVGGMISFEDGDKHFDELSESEKFNVLHDLAQTTSATVEEEHGLDEEEVGLINWIREQNQPLQQSIELLAQQRVEQILALSESGSTDFSAMSDDAVMMKWLQSNDPEASEEDLAEELARAKDGKFFVKTVEKYREQFVREQTVQQAEAREDEHQEMYAEIEEQRSLIATTVANIKDVVGFEVSEEDKNLVLHDLLEVNEYGDSLFMEEVFSDPERLFKAAWLYKNAEAYMDELEKHYKKEISKAFHSGKSEAINGLSREPIGGSNGNPGKTNKIDPVRVEKFSSLEDLHSDD